MCICEHILCYWLIDFFVFSMFDERISKNIVLCWIWDLITYRTFFLNLLYHALHLYLDVHLCEHIFFSYSYFGCAKIEVHETLILIPGSKAYTNWYHIFHIDIDTFVACKKNININISRVFGF